MKQIFVYALLLVLSFDLQAQISEVKLLEDYDFLVEELRTYHQGLYQYVDKNTVNRQIDSIRSTITASDKIDFYKKVNALISLTNEGHSGADLPFWTKTKFGLSKSFVPIRIEFADKKAIITKYYSKDNPGIQFGDQLISVNGHSVDEIMSTLKPYIVTDGFNETSLYEWVSWNFPLYYALIYGKENEFDLVVKKFDDGNTKIINVKVKNALKLKNKKNTLSTVKRPIKFEYRKVSKGVGYLSIPNFYSLDDFETFYRKSFTSIKNDKITHLIIDIQNNIGGNEGNENLLASYLFGQPFHKYENVLAPRAAYEDFKNDKSVIADKWEVINNIPHRGKFTLMSNYFSDFDYKKPNKDLLYEGKIYALISGVTFSGGAEFASMLKMTNRAIFIGKETGGAYEGNVSGHNRDIKLPKTKIKVSIPIVHFKINVKPKNKGRGVIPDYRVPQSWKDIIEGKNSKLEYVLELIKNAKD